MKDADDDNKDKKKEDTKANEDVEMKENLDENPQSNGKTRADVDEEKHPLEQNGTRIVDVNIKDLIKHDDSVALKEKTE